MRLLFGFFVSGMLFFSCNSSERTPDVSNIKIDTRTRRFEQELFKLDTADFAAHLQQLIARYPGFGDNFLFTILGADEKWNNDSIAGYVKGFIRAYKTVYDS